MAPDQLEILQQHIAAVEALIEGLKRHGGGEPAHFEVRVNLGPVATTAKLVDGARIDSFQGKRPKGKTA